MRTWMPLGLLLGVASCQCGYTPVGECGTTGCQADGGVGGGGIGAGAGGGAGDGGVGGGGGGLATGGGAAGGSGGGFGGNGGFGGAGAGAGGFGGRGADGTCAANFRACTSELCAYCPPGATFCCPKVSAFGPGTLDFHAFGIDRNDLVRFVAYETFGKRILISRSSQTGFPNFTSAKYADPFCPDCGPWPSMAIDPQNNVHLAYLDVSSTRRVKYLYEVQGGVQTIETIETIESMMSDEGPTSIAVDGSGGVHVTYVANGALRYARKVPSGWQKQTVAAAGQRATVALAGAAPHLGLSIDGTLQHAVADGGAFATDVVVGTSNGQVFDSSVAVDSSGNPSIAFVHPTQRDVRLAHLDGGVWISEVIDPLPCEGSLHLKLSEQDVPHLVYLESTGRPRHASKLNGGWVLRNLDSAVARNVSLAVDQYGVPHAMFFVPGSPGNLYYVH